MNNQQKTDRNKCEEMDSKGETMECWECSCSICIAQEPTDYKSGLEKARVIIKNEITVAREINSQMAMGMSQVLTLIKKELDK